MEFDQQYYDARALALKWLLVDPDKRDFAKGVQILTDMRFKPGLARKLKMLGEKPILRTTLSMAIRDAIAICRHPDRMDNDEDVDADVENMIEGPQQSTAESAAVAEEGNHQDSEKFKALPETIQYLVKKHADAFNKRAVLHRQFYNIPEDNNSDHAEARAQLSAKIDRLTEFMDKLYPLREEYDQTGDAPTMEEINAIVNEYMAVKDAPVAKAPAKTREGISEALANSSLVKKDEDFENMPKDKLVSRRHSLVTHIKKKENQLRYQSDKKLEKDNPMPDSPKRTKLETQLRLMKDKLYLADKALAKFG